MPTLARVWKPFIVDVRAKRRAYDWLDAPQNRFLAPLIKPGIRVLEAGSGGGGHVFAFARAGARAVGVDRSRGLIARMMEEAERLGLANATGIVGDMLNLPFGDGSFKLYTSIGVYEHFPCAQHRRLFQEAYRVLEPGGLIYLEVSHLWSPGSLRKEASYWLRRFGSEPLAWQRNLSRGYIINCGEQAGFFTHTSHVFGAWPEFVKWFGLDSDGHRWLPNPFQAMGPTLRSLADWCEERELLGSTLVYIGRKPRRR